MEYLIPILLVILLVAGFVTFFVINATSKSGPNAEGEQGPPGIGADDAPLGDTTQHAGDQPGDGTTRGRSDAGASGGTGEPIGDAGAAGNDRRAGAPADPDQAAHVARPGEGEGAERLEFDGKQPSRAPIAGRGD